MPRARAKGFTIIELMVVVAVIGTIIALAIPGLMRAREVSRASSCQENLVKIVGAVDSWALEYDKRDGDTVAWQSLVGKTLYLKKAPVCRGGGSYGGTFTVGTTPTCDYTPPLWFDTQGNKYEHTVSDATD
ncbi:type II secretion system protein [Candidatus Sumerlaeota bacterium]|nr:type II secretion system protein [Candidatus Sumerlaeota bacterium]